MGKVLLVMGHRNTRGDETIGELERTPLVVNAAARELKRAGHEVHVLQQEDGIDGDPNFTHADLSFVAQHAATLIRRHGIEVMIDAHFQGSPNPTSGCFCIFPDAPGDSKAMNVLDVNFSRRLSEEVSRQTGIRRLPLSEPGFPGGMSETQTGVGAGGGRLGMFSQTVSERDRCVRVVMEHGDTRADTAAINSPGFYDRVAQAYVDAVNAFWPVAPISDEFFVFDEPRTFTAHAGALGRSRAGTDADVVKEYEAGEAIRCIGYYESQFVAGDRRWLRSAGEGSPRIHRSGVVEEIPQGTQTTPPPGLQDIPSPNGIGTSEEALARAEAAARGPSASDPIADTTVIGCAMTISDEAPVLTFG